MDKINNVFMNNILYNFEAGYTTHTSTHFNHDIVNNYFVYGPTGKNEWFQVDKSQSIYASGNMIDTDRDGKLNGGPSSIYYYQGVGEELAKPWSELTTRCWWKNRLKRIRLLRASLTSIIFVQKLLR